MRIFGQIKQSGMLNNLHLSVLVERQAEKYGERAALLRREASDGTWKEVSWNSFSARVSAVSRALVAFGLGRGERLAVFSQNMPECFYAAFGAYGAGVVCIPFYATSSGAQVTYMLNDSEARLLFVGEQEQYDTAFSVVSLCKTLEKIVIFDPTVVRKPTDTLSVTFEEFLATGRPGDAAEVKRRQEAATWDDTADILYTSGTTGASKGVMLTYGMYHAAIEGNDAVLPLSESDVFLNFLPFTHVFERGWAYLGLAEGVVEAVNQHPQDVLRALQEVRPTCMCSVPRFWEKVYQGVQAKIPELGRVERALTRRALKLGMSYWERYGSRAKAAPPTLALQLKFYDRTVFRLLRKMLGLERANFFPTAGATVSPEVECFVHAVGLYMMVGYGLTESTATVSNDHKGAPNTLGSVGRPLPGLEVKISAEGEILLRGKTITPGYYKKATTTRATIDAEGWFHTGDAGYLEGGELFLKERIKDLFKTSNGKYVAPQMIESKLTIDRYIEQCVVVADKRKFVSALIVPDYNLLADFARREGLRATTRAELCSDPTIHAKMAERIDTLQQDLAGYERVKHFLLLPEPFTMENGELTNTLKVKRNVVYERYAAQIEKLYEEAEKAYAKQHKA